MWQENACISAQKNIFKLFSFNKMITISKNDLTFEIYFFVCKCVVLLRSFKQYNYFISFFVFVLLLLFFCIQCYYYCNERKFFRKQIYFYNDLSSKNLITTCKLQNFYT